MRMQSPNKNRRPLPRKLRAALPGMISAPEKKSARDKNEPEQIVQILRNTQEKEEEEKSKGIKARIAHGTS